MASTEFRTWLDRISQLESAVKDERSRRREFEDELKKMNSDSMFAVSRGELTTGARAGGAPVAAKGANVVTPVRGQ
jgi:hypothetical protein